MSELQITGERYHPTMRGFIRYEHLHRYALCLGMVAGLDVLDVASGEGYGTALLASRAKRVTGVDIDVRAIEHARHGYYRANVRYLVGDATALPLADASVDVVVSFETLEQIDNHDQMLGEIRRVLRPGGRLVMSSSNKLVYSDAADYVNPYHVRELYYDEFLRLLERHFPAVRVHGQRLAAASFVYPLADRAPEAVPSFGANGDEVRAGVPPLDRPVNFIAVCGDEGSDLAAIDSFFLDAHEDVLAMLQHEHERALRQLRSDGGSRAGAEAEQPAFAAYRAPEAPPALDDAGSSLLPQLQEHAGGAPPEPADAHAHVDDAFRAEYERLRAELDVVRRDYVDACADRDAAGAMRFAERAEADALRLEQQAEESRAMLVEAQRDGLAEQLRAVLAERDELSALADSTQARHDEASAALDAQSAELAALLRERDHWLAERDSATLRAESLDAEHDALAAKRDALRAERDVLRGERDALRAERDGLRGDQDVLAAQVEALAADRDALASERDQLRAEHGPLAAERAALQARLDEAAAELATARTQRDELAERARAAADAPDAAELERLQDERAKLQRRFDAVLREMEKLRERLDANDQELAMWRGGTSPAASAARRLSFLVSALEEQVAELSTTHEELAQVRAAHGEYVSNTARDVDALRRMLGSRSWKLTAPLRALARGRDAAE